MNYIESMKKIIDKNERSDWYYLKIEQPGISDKPEFSLINEWRKLMNSTCSMGSLSNRVFMRRYITDGGFWIRFVDGDTDKLMVYFQTKKHEVEKTGFNKHLIMRYFSSCRLRPNIELTTVKPLNGQTLFDVISNQINFEIDKAIDSGTIPQIKSSKFGSFFGNNETNKKIENEEFKGQ